MQNYQGKWQQQLRNIRSGCFFPASGYSQASSYISLPRFLFAAGLETLGSRHQNPPPQHRSRGVWRCWGALRCSSLTYAALRLIPDAIVGQEKQSDLSAGLLKWNSITVAGPRFAKNASNAPQNMMGVKGYPSLFPLSTYKPKHYWYLNMEVSSRRASSAPPWPARVPHAMDLHLEAAPWGNRPEMPISSPLPALPQWQNCGYSTNIWNYHQTERFFSPSQLFFLQQYGPGWRWKCFTGAWCCLQPDRNRSISPRGTVTLDRQHHHRLCQKPVAASSKAGREWDETFSLSLSLTHYWLKRKKLPG